MRLWRLSSARRARTFDGGYGVAHSGRWNTAGRPLTYCATVPSLTALEKRVHVASPHLLPPQAMVEYDVPDDLVVRRIEVHDLPTDWTRREVETQRLGNAWLDAAPEDLLMVPSVVVPIASAPDRNVLINHRRPASARISIVAIVPFTLDPRLFAR
jgi:RES domain-containing protein